MRFRARSLVWLAALGLGAVGLVRAFRPTPVIVDAATVVRGDLVVTVDDDGRTRVRERYTIHAPVRGRLLRTALDPGDAVRAGVTLVAEFEPVVPSLLDARARVEAEAQLARARSAVEEVRARREQAEADRAYAEAEHGRIAELCARGIVSPGELEVAERDRRARREAVRAAEFAVQVAAFEADVAAATLVEPDAAPRDGETAVGTRRLALRSPIDGAVLRVFEGSARTLDAGAPLVELGDVRSIEVVADYLTQDAVQLRPGMPAAIVGWGGEYGQGLAARVRLVEPSGYTKISALGVEEQRVDVVLDPDGDRDAWARLGDGFRVDVRVEVWRGDGVLLAPTGALFRQGAEHAVFVDVDGRARVRTVRIGHRTGLDAEVLEGLTAGERVVLYPSNLVRDGVPVAAR